MGTLCTIFGNANAFGIPLGRVACGGGVINDAGHINGVDSCETRLIDNEDGKDSRGGGHTIGGISGIASVLPGVGAMCSLCDISISIAGNLLGSE